MAWRYQPKTPDSEAQVTLSEYHAGLRAAELRNRLEVDVDSAPPTAGRFDLGRLIARLKNAVHAGRNPDGDQRP